MAKMMSRLMLRSRNSLPQSICQRVRQPVYQYALQEEQSVTEAHQSKFCTSSASLSKNSEEKPEKKSRVLKLLSLIMQDGNEFKDMPALVRIRSALEKPPVQSYSFSGASRKSDDFNLQLALQLQEANSLQDIYSRLQIPTDQISAESAAFGLQKIWLLKEERIKGDDPDTFVSEAIMNELYNTVSRDIGKISCSTLFMLLDSFYMLGGWKESFGCDIQEEIEKRIGDHRFNFEELCTLSKILCRYKDLVECGDLLDKVWIHVQNRWKEINADSIAEIYSSVPEKYFRVVQRLLADQLESIYWKLNSSDVRIILSELNTRNCKNAPELKYFAKWARIVINQIMTEDLEHIVKSLMDLEHVDQDLLAPLNLYVTKKCISNTINVDSMLLFLTYCYTFSRNSNMQTLAKASEHFMKNYQMYTHRQVQTLLSVFSHVKYIPTKYQDFFYILEKYLHEEIYTMDCRVLMDIITSVIIMRRKPLLFYKHVFSYRFFAQVLDLTGEEFETVLSQIDLFKSTCGRLIPNHLYVDRTVLTDEISKHVLFNQKHKIYPPAYDQQSKIILRLLVEAYGEENVFHNSRREFGLIDFEYHMTPQKSVDDFSEVEICRKNAVLVFDDDCFLLNANVTLLGKPFFYSMHLKNKGYNVIEIRTEDLMKTAWASIQAPDIHKVLNRIRIEGR